MLATHFCKESIWIKHLCSYVGLYASHITIYCDSQSVIFFTKNPTFYAKTKNIDVQFHFVHDMAEDRMVNFEKIDTLTNVADALTKLVSTKKFR